jgi:hypothetical protein
VSPRAREALPWLYQSVAAGSTTTTGGAAVTAGITYNTYILPVPMINNHDTENYYYNNANILMNLNNQIDDGILYNILMAMNNMNNTNNNNNNNN